MHFCEMKLCPTENIECIQNRRKQAFRINFRLERFYLNTEYLNSYPLFHLLTNIAIIVIKAFSYSQLLFPSYYMYNIFCDAISISAPG